MSLEQNKGVSYLNPTKVFDFDTLNNCEIKSNTHMTLSFINHTDEDVIVVFPNGLSTTIVPDHGEGYDHFRKREFIIRKGYVFSTNHAVRNAQESLQALKRHQGELSLELSKLLSYLERGHEINMRHSSVVFNVDIPILGTDLQAGKALFVEDTGIMITTSGHVALTVPHPYTREGRMIGEWNKKHIDTYEAGISVAVVDNVQICPVRYFYAGKSIIAVPSNRDSTKESGVYVTMVIQNNQGILEPKVSYYSFDEAEEIIGLYRTIDEAESHGNPENISKAEEAMFRREELQLKNELRVAEQKFAHEKHLHDVEISRLSHEQSIRNIELEKIKGENERLKHELSTMKSLHEAKIASFKTDLDIESSERKNKDEKKSSKRKRKEDKYKQKFEKLKLKRNDHYEERSAIRKDTSEILKYAPLVITGGLALFSVINAISSKKSSASQGF